MGKTAKNEQIKLKAAFYNNLALALLASGAIIPYFTIWPSKHPFADVNAFKDSLSAFVAIGLAFGLGLHCRLKAHWTIGELED